VLAVFAASALSAFAEENLDPLWHDACLWEVGSNAEKVPAARKALIEKGAAALDYLIPAKLDTGDGLVIRGLETVIPGIANGPDPALRDKAISQLMAALDSEKPNARRNAASLLGACNATEAAPKIAKLLADKDARGGALTALGALKVQSSAPEIAALAQDAAAPERARVAAVATLGAIGGPDAQKALLDLLHDKAAAVRFAAQYALETLRSIGALVATLDGFDRRARLHALSALGRIGAREARPAVRRWCDDADPVVRGFAVEAMTAMRKPSDRVWMEKRLASERDPFVIGKLRDGIRAGEAKSR
jgi:HEAT repeat protein